ncbi:hypothetical protein OROMI_011756 [Orobanche minor]
MLATDQSSSSGHHQLTRAPKSSRRPLQPNNLTPNITTTTSNLIKPNLPEWADISRLLDNSNKENLPPIYSSAPLKKQSFPMKESFDSSLADELIAIRGKLERLRVDRDKTDKLLKERGFVLDLKFKEILRRGEIQKQLEIEVDRLYRLQEIRLACTRISQIRSLRDKQHERR